MVTENKTGLKRKLAEAKRLLNSEVSDNANLKKFDTASKTYSAKVTKSRATARKELVKLGFITNAGKLTKRYK